MNVAVEKRFIKNKGVEVTAGVSISNYLSFSQRYHVIYPPNHVHKGNQIRLFGMGAGAHASLLKKFGKISVGPIISLPLFDIWKKDPVFPQEDNDKIRSKWLGGFGVGVSFQYALNVL